ncbi:RNA degradosome polyphosphate kinase [Amycolatopsis sp. PS_44_ISF1]|uniref:RNA degradosome polyphosphate kinase n=1 Tax=Amycolatopsis sp. PS_44_ISF1 TaxID=2974917 RepID=UPI0028DEED5D|nr:RNA degradosome polyphosphate kinase [Amycolatopsis sp. PS_44_ISF1]MDT8915641.1 RNA degradosome polyphosphate kinase [Amycolatopsis sp. PS_44_ISF1]
MGSVSTDDGSTPARGGRRGNNAAKPAAKDTAPRRTSAARKTGTGEAVPKSSASARAAARRATTARSGAPTARKAVSPAAKSEPSKNAPSRSPQPAQSKSAALRSSASKPATPKSRESKNAKSASGKTALAKITARASAAASAKEAAGEEFRAVPSAPPAVTSTAPTAVETLPDDRYFNRELSWQDFNARVLALAEDESQALLERAKFLAIFASNLDEFYMVRVAGLKRRDETGLPVRSADGLTPREQLDYIAKRNQDLVERHTAAFEEHLRPQLAEQDIRIVGWADLAGADQLRLSSYFSEQIFPVLTPLAVDPAHPFPYISGLSLNLAVTVRDPQGGTERFARVKVPSNVPRLMRVEQERTSRTATFLPLEELIAAHLGELFSGMEVIEHHIFRVTRNADFEVEEDRDEDLLQALERELAQRRFGPPVRLEVAQDMSEHMLELLLRELEVDPADVVEVPGLLDLTCLFQLSGVDRKELKDRPFVPATHPAFGERETPKSVFATLREGDVLVHHPYDSFSTSVQRFIEQAAADSKVLAIKQTLYRTSGDSPIVDALIDAAEAGKQVVALVEIKARFDEQANIAWARTLERAGVHVVYGLVGLKTHCKVSMVVRQEGATIRRYCHIGTGNYNPKTARLYEDLGLLTADPSVGADITDLFNVLTGYSRQDTYRTLLTSPHGIRRGIVRAIGEEIELARAGQRAGIRIKCNSLVDEQVIDALYHASQAGVPVDVVVRGICSLKPGVEGLSENIRVRSILGRFLEHSRVFHFRAGGTHWIGSADMMHRNLDRRIEALVRVKDPKLTQQLDAVLDSALDPATRCWVLSATGEWQPFPAAGSQVRDHQTELAKLHGAAG